MTVSLCCIHTRYSGGMNALVNLGWLVEHLHDRDVIVLDATLPPVSISPPVDTRARYIARHIPGAIFFDINELSDHATSLPHMLPSENEFGHKVGAMGISDGTTIVVYEQEGVFSAPRAWWMLRVMGARDVRLLDGGLRAWVEAGFAVESGTLRHVAAEFTAKLNCDSVRDFAAIQQIIANQGQIFDARSIGRFSGTAPEPRPGIRSGHMPGARNLPFTEVSENSHMKSPEALRKIFHTKGANLGQPITTTCGSGVTAAVLVLALELAGAEKVHLYDGSWSEYAQRSDAVIVSGTSAVPSQ